MDGLNFLGVRNKKPKQAGEKGSPIFFGEAEEPHDAQAN